MAIQFELITDTIREMGAVAAERKDNSNLIIEELLKKLKRYRTNWSYIDLCLNSVLWNPGKVDKQKYRAAKPLFETEPLDEGIDAPDVLPERATLISTDGSQALPTRHAAYLYYLINTGTIIYHHGSGTAPQEISIPALHYLGDGNTESADDFRSNRVSIQRDMAEIDTLSRTVWENKYATAPIIAILDQRLQYFPIGVNDREKSTQYVGNWIKGIETIQACNGIAVGYIERPETSAVVRLLMTLDLKQPNFDPAVLNERPEIADVVLYRRVLKPGQRSCVFEVVNESTNYAPFREAHQEICFFYYNPPGTGDVTRVDIPKRAAQQPEVVEMVHGLLNEQCKLLGNYPYVLTRADEIAVVQRSDQEYLDHLITLEMERRGIHSRMTGKQFGKDITRAGKQRHSL